VSVFGCFKPATNFFTAALHSLFTSLQKMSQTLVTCALFLLAAFVCGCHAGAFAKNFAGDLKTLATKSGDCKLVNNECKAAVKKFVAGLKQPKTDTYKQASCCKIDSAKKTIDFECKIAYGKKEDVSKEKVEAKCAGGNNLDPIKTKSFTADLKKVATETGNCGKVKAECTKKQNEFIKTLKSPEQNNKKASCCSVDATKKTISADCVVINGGKEQIRQATVNADCSKISWALPKPKPK